MCIRLIIVESMEHLVAKLRHMRTMNMNIDNRAIVAVQLVENC